MLAVTMSSPSCRIGAAWSTLYWFLTCSQVWVQASSAYQPKGRAHSSSHCSLSLKMSSSIRTVHASCPGFNSQLVRPDLAWWGQPVVSHTLRMWETTCSPLGGTGTTVWNRVVPHSVHWSPCPSVHHSTSLGKCFCAQDSPYPCWFSWKDTPSRKKMQ